jgi:hypothetical protein
VDIVNYRLVFAASLSLLWTLAAVPAPAATSAQTAAIAALRAALHAQGNNDVEQPACYVIQTWAQCSFGTGGGNAEGNAWLHDKNGKWKLLGTDGGVTYASMMEKRYGIPADVAKKFQAKICPSPCPGS